MPDDKAQVKFGADTGDLTSAMQSVQSSVAQALDKMTSALQTMTEQGKKNSQDLADSNKKIADSFSSLQGIAEKSVAGVTGSLAALKTKFEAIVGILAGGTLFKSAIDSTIKWESEVAKLARTCGITTEQASGLNMALRLVGTDADTYVSALSKLERQLRTNEQTLRDWGMVTRDGNNQLVNGQQAMQNAVAMIKQYKQGLDEGFAGQIAFGKGAEAMAPLLRLNEEIMARAKQMAQDLGLEIGVNDVAAMRKYQIELNAFKALWTAVESQIGKEVLKTLTQLANYLNNDGQSAVKNMGEAVKSLVRLFASLAGAIRLAGLAWEYFSKLPKAVGGDLKQLPMLFTSDKARAFAGMPQETDSEKLNAWYEVGATRIQEEFEKAMAALNANVSPPKDSPESGGTKSAPGGASADVTAWKADLEAQKIDYQNWGKDVHQLEAQFWADKLKQTVAGSDQAKEVWGNLMSAQQAIFDKGQKDSSKGASTNIVSTWQGELEKIKNSQEDLNAWSLSKDYQFWNEKLAATRKGSEEWQTVWNKMAEIYRSMSSQQQAELQKQEAAKLKIQEEDAKASVAHEQAMYDLQKTSIDACVQLGQISEAKGLQLEKQMLDQRYNQQEAALAAEAQAMLQSPNYNPAKLEAIYIQMRAITDKYWKDTASLENKGALDSKRTWDSIASSVSSSVNNMLFSTQSFTQKLQSLFQSMAERIIDVIIKKIVTEWIGGETTKTAATAGGEAARLGIQQTAQSEGLMASFAMKMKEISATAYSAGAKAYDAVVGIPIIGPILAPPAAAVAFAAVMAFGGGIPSAAGGWEVPADTFAYVHKDEKILPAATSKKIDAMTSSGGGGLSVHNPQFHFHGDHWEQGLKSNPSALYKAIERGIRDNALKWKK